MKLYYQPEIETASREQILAWQNERLVAQVKHVWDNVPYYRQKMEEKGLIERRSVGEKQYRAMILLTEKGRHAADYVAQRATEIVAKAVEGLTDEARGVMYASLELISCNLQKLEDID
jgi:predicted transcriptional regulator